ncbi:hypothetical protein K2P56_00015 [Patescibacteria group bacterium]|nr:hypothetical protein [Patescibacteria group bacterium]
MRQESGTKVLIAGAVSAVLIIGFIAFFAFQKTQPLWSLPASPEESEKAYSYAPNPNSSIIKFTEGVHSWYVNERLGFSFRLPDGFKAPDGKVSGSDTHVVELSNGKGNDLHVVVLKIKAGADQTLSEEAVRANTPEEALSNFRSGVLPDGTSGFVFETDSEKWNGAGVAFWFSKGGYLFTLSTAKKDMELLDMVMETWNFGRPIPPPPPQN